MKSDYLKDVFGNLSSTRKQSYHTHLFTLALIAVAVIVYMVYCAISIYRCEAASLVDIPENVVYAFLGLVGILLTYASAPKAFSQRFEWKSYTDINKSKDSSNEPK